MQPRALSRPDWETVRGIKTPRLHGSSPAVTADPGFRIRRSIGWAQSWPHDRKPRSPRKVQDRPRPARRLEAPARLVPYADGCPLERPASGARQAEDRRPARPCPPYRRARTWPALSSDPDAGDARAPGNPASGPSCAPRGPAAPAPQGCALRPRPCPARQWLCPLWPRYLRPGINPKGAAPAPCPAAARPHGLCSNGRSGRSPADTSGGDARRLFRSSDACRKARGAPARKRPAPARPQIPHSGRRALAADKLPRRPGCSRPATAGPKHILTRACIAEI
ncbi:hypothetical protein HNE_0277 [Hyphomonas neptunium ATCC 15444]|uniref:Uncharacterized protein n=1 Tax=Hyphomonas neptunium (strain ATCC 15444) TaxID=228405 RepID=Q0C5I5_HYPNA|nr:hypothetical protein HNE_0277 [Hyphomonas neptunium ATCC 15444]